MDCRDPLAARADDRLDELAVGILVAAVEQLAQRVRAIGPFVVDAGEIERPQRIVRRTNDEQASEAASELFQAVAQRCDFESGQLLARMASEISPARAQLVSI